MRAFMKLHGIGTFQQLSGAREGLEQAVARGYQPAKAALGYMYLSGLGGDRDMETGEAYLTEAAEAGVASAAYYRQRYEAERVEQDASPDTQ
jgi:TPR repeat protein